MKGQFRMSDSTGKLSEAEREKAVSWFNTRWTMQNGCPVCTTKKWQMSDHLVHSPVFAGGAALFGGVVYPVLPLTCSNCGYTIYFNAVMMGLTNTEAGVERPTVSGTTLPGLMNAK